MKKAFALACIILCSCAALPKKEPGLKLVDNKKPEAVILISQKASHCAKKASKALIKYLEQISGAKLKEIKIPQNPKITLEKLTGGKNAILIGDNRFVRLAGIKTQDLPNDGFIIKTQGKSLIIAGKDGKNYCDNYRYCTDSAGTLYGVYRFLEYLGARWLNPSELGTIIPHKSSIEIPSLDIKDSPYFKYRHIGYGSYSWARKLGAGGDRDPWSTMHTVSINLKKKYGKSHPEYFLKDPNGKTSSQADFKNPELVKIVTDMAKKHFDSKQLKGQKYFLILPLDGKACMETDTEYITSAIENIANKLKKEYPECKIVHCPYSNFVKPPKKERKLPENMSILLAFSRARLFPPNTAEDYYKVISDWQKFQPAEICFCRYNGERLKMSPALIPQFIGKDIKKLKEMSETGKTPITGEMNFVSLKTDSEFAWWEFINEYVAAKMLWNPDLNVDDIIKDYCQKMFGPAAEDMEEFLEICEAAYLAPEERDFFKPDTVLKLENLIKDAKEKTKATEYAKRVEYFSKGIEPLRCMRKKLLSSNIQTPENGEKRKPIHHYSFDENEGAIAKDKIAQQTGAINNAERIDGISGKALRFSGDKSFVKLPPIELKDADYSFEAWIKPEKMEKGTQYIFGPESWERRMLAIEYLYATEATQN
jgi:hypothetical protein